METKKIGIYSEDLAWEKRSYDATLSPKSYDLLISPLIIDGEVMVRLLEYEDSKSSKKNEFIELDEFKFPQKKLSQFIDIFKNDIITWQIR